MRAATLRAWPLRFVGFALVLHSDVANAATFFEVFAGHDMIFLNPREVTFFFLIVIAACTIFNILFTLLEMHKSPLVQSIYASSTRAIIVIGMNSVLLGFVTGFFDPTTISEDQLIVLHWVYFVFFFWMVLLVVVSIILVVGLYGWCRLIKKRELKLLQAGGKASGDDRKVDEEDVEMKERQRKAAETHEDEDEEGNRLLHTDGPLPSISVSDAILTLRRSVISALYITNPESADAIAKNEDKVLFSNYLYALQRWDAGSFTDLDAKDWGMLFIFCLVNSLRKLGLAAAPQITDKDNYLSDYLSYVFVMGLLPFFGYVAGCVMLRNTLVRYTAAVRKKHQEAGQHWERSLSSIHYLQHPTLHCIKGRLDLVITFTKSSMQLELFFLVVLVVDYLFVVNPLEAGLAFIPVIIVILTSPFVSVVASALINMGPVFQIDVGREVILKQLVDADDKADDHSEGGSPDDTANAARKQRIQDTKERGVNAEESQVSTILAARERSALKASGVNPLLPMIDDLNSTPLLSRRAAEDPDEAERREKEEEDAKNKEAELIKSRLRATYAPPVSLDKKNDEFHVYCALERARQVLDEVEEQNEKLQKMLEHERAIDKQIAGKTKVIKDVLTERRPLESMPFDLEWCTIMDVERTQADLLDLVPNPDRSSPRQLPSSKKQPRVSEDWRKLLQERPDISSAWMHPPARIEGLDEFLDDI